MYNITCCISCHFLIERCATITTEKSVACDQLYPCLTTCESLWFGVAGTRPHNHFVVFTLHGLEIKGDFTFIVSIERPPAIAWLYSCTSGCSICSGCRCFPRRSRSRVLGRHRGNQFRRYREIQRLRILQEHRGNAHQLALCIEQAAAAGASGNGGGGLDERVAAVIAQARDQPFGQAQFQALRCADRIHALADFQRTKSRDPGHGWCGQIDGLAICLDGVACRAPLVQRAIQQGWIKPRSAISLN